MTDLAKTDTKPTNDKASEDELLVSPSKVPSTPTETTEGPPPAPVAAVDSKAKADDGNDAIADRLQTIFGQKRASDDVTDSEPVSKVVNTGASNVTAASSTIATTEMEVDTDANVTPAATTTPVSDGTGDKPSTTSTSTSTSQASPSDTRVVDMDLGDNDGGDNSGAVNNSVPGDDAPGNDGAPGNGAAPDGNGWPEEVDQPAEFPDVGFPLAPPTYPTAPEFTYRYRSGAQSTPQRRRIDFDRSIVLPNCRRDPHTNRIAQDDYDAREQAEMALSLGYAFIHSFLPFLWFPL